MRKFRIRLLRMIDENETDLTGYRTGYVQCEVDVEAQTLYQAILIVEGKFSDRNKYRVDYNNSCMILSPIFLSE